jgi:ribose/xylose/arabinose/galactoside ABC-type transport system permease subunit
MLDGNENSVSVLTRSFFLKYKMLLVLLALVAFLSAASDVFLTTRNITNVLRQISINAILGIGVTYVILTGGIDLSLGSIVAFSGVISTAVVKHGGHDWVFIGLLCGIAAGIACGLVSGALVSILKAPAFVATLAMMTAIRGFALMFTDGRPVTGFDSGFLQLGQGEILFLPTPVAVLILVLVVSAFILSYTRFGRYIYAVGGNAEAARVSGVSVKSVITSAYVICGACAGLAGVILASRINAGQPVSGQGSELDAIAAVVIGGTSLSGGVGGVFGTIVGALIIGVINNGLNLMEVSSYWQQVFKGVIIGVAVVIDIWTNRKKS